MKKMTVPVIPIRSKLSTPIVTAAIVPAEAEESALRTSQNQIKKRKDDKKTL